MARVTVVPEPIDYPGSDGLRMAENESQFWPILYVGSALDRYYRDRDDVYVVGNLLLYYREGNPREDDFGASIPADLMVVIGASKHVRSSYKLWEEPKAPGFVLEIASAGTYRADSGKKRDTYSAPSTGGRASGTASARPLSGTCGSVLLNAEGVAT